MRVRSFQARVVLLFLVLVTVVQVCSLIAVTLAITRNARAQVEDRLTIGARVFSRLVGARTRHLAEAAHLLSSDFAFKTAVSAEDRETVLSVLENHQARVGADVMVLLSLQGEVVADTLPGDALALRAAARRLVARAEGDRQAAALGIVSQHAYQMVVVPLLAPLPIAWIGVGFLVDDAVARDLQTLTNLHVSFVKTGGGADPRLLASTLPNPLRQTLAAVLPGISASETTRSAVRGAGEEYLTLTVPLGQEDDAAIVAVLQQSLREALRPFRRLQATLLGLALGSVVVTAIVGLALARRVTQPVRTLAEGARRVEQGQYDVPVCVDQQDEIGELASAFNHMMKGLAERDRVREELDRVGRLKRFLSPQLAELVVSSGDDAMLGSHRQEITVVFCDLRGFTAFSETAEPEEVMGVLGEYHAAVGPLIFASEGTLERFAGDGLMVFFNDPIPCPDPAARAVKMAVAMRERVSSLITSWENRGHALGFGVGIAMGYATLGRIGFEGRFDYAAIGTVTNLSARLCDAAQDRQILVSQRIYAAVEELVGADPLPPLTLKGFSRPVAVFNVVRLKTAVSADSGGAISGGLTAHEANVRRPDG